ncbi:DUF4011 domain-containing protein [Defluviimonas salinarum]|uniref:DUF4011 domain-containing protein n=1 Tax=Defluviimonas salinarum TaxID=2992147 RepID=A0ABT3J859_9RHOB|nr:DUF4011 domain-containing protein [Defluviimonas salinarum]MCW3783868.1 DUF4011 domain-containing protein [Defluviimonas salinarum]
MSDLRLTMVAQPGFCRTKEWAIDRIPASETVELRDRDVALDFATLDRLNEAEFGQLTFRLCRGDEILAEHVAKIELLARDEWGGSGEMAQILAAFVSPNHAQTARILKEASRLLEQAGHSGALNGYQSGDPARTYILAAAVWSAVTAMGLSYAEPPKSFELTGQKIRDPGTVAETGLATCLDTALLMAAALEATGLNPAVIFTEGHAFAGVWLTDRTFPATVERDVTEIRKAIAAREFVPFETTLLTQRPSVGFDHAVANGGQQLSEEREAGFRMVVDIGRARSAGIRPLSNRKVADAMGVAEPHEVAAAPLPKAPDFRFLPAETAEEPQTPQGRIERWQKKLLDLSLRNRLLNFSETKQTLSFVCPDVPALEDALADGARFRVISLNDENPVGDRDPKLYRQQTGRDIHADFAARAFEKKQLCAPVTGSDMKGRLTTLYRKAKADLAEGGTNTLFLAVGFLRWKKTETDTRSYKAPLLLLPIKLNRRSAQSDFYLSHHEDDITFNQTLLQFLEQDFGLTVPALRGDLPTDHSGLDIARIFDLMRAAVREVPGFEVTEDIAVSTFSFAKYLMWKDLVDRTDSLRNNRLVRHLIDNPTEPFAGGEGGLPDPREIDLRVPPSNLFLPLPADSSQIAAVVAAEEGKDFVVIGPPGTGKSQTIANMVAHCLASGKTVLFVAEKSAALDVVHRRLKAYGLADACLELHSNKTDRKSVIGQLGAAWDRAAADQNGDWLRLTGDLEIRRDELNDYVADLHRPGSHGYSIFDAIGTVAGRTPAFRLAFASAEAHDSASFRSLEDLSDRLFLTHTAVTGFHGLDSIARTDWSFSWQNELTGRVETLEVETHRFAEACLGFASALGLTADPDLAAERLAVLDRLATVIGKTAERDFRIALDASFDSVAQGLGAFETAVQDYRREQARLSARYEDAELARIPLDELDRDWRKAEASLWPLSALGRRRVRKLLQSYAASGKANPATEIAPLRALQESIGAVGKSPLSALPAFAGTRSDPEALRGYLAEAGELRAALAELARLAGEAGQALSALDAVAAAGGEGTDIARKAAAFHVAKARFDSARAAYETVADGPLDAASLSDLRRTLDAVKAQVGQLQDWVKWAAVRQEAEVRGLAPLIEALRDGKVADAREAFRVSYFSWWLPLAVDESPLLRSFVHWEQEDRVERFRELDRKVQALAAAQVRHRVAHGLPSRDGVARNSELGTLRHQLGLQRPRISIRQLLGAMPETFTRLTPCVLMSPLSVAQYLPADQALFDIVIFDEASQITTWDAVGAIARGRQSIIVGDPKQLPPTNFFGRADDDEGNDDLATYEKDLPSILDEATAAGLPEHRLNWHYRSRDEALIAFSNHHYYKTLVTFPPPKTETDAVQFHFVGGVYARGSGRTNEAEARAITRLATRRMLSWLKHPEPERPTLGIITFNAQQQELILDLLDAERRTSPELEWFFDDEREEPVIVKNLENIQGDERDVMLFSITFGPDKAGKLSMSFGAINLDGGEKRLNVAVTRARAELHVFASIRAEDIDTTRAKGLGVAHLKNFLDYAARGALALPAMEEGSLGPAESPFEDAVARALRGRGWEVRTQIGVSGFRIDLGVVHPDKAGAYLAGVECDGATYHRSATARDRDQIREAVLRNLGWEILRIWSTDWFMREAEALDRVDAALRRLLEDDRAARTVADKEDSEEGDAKDLIDPEPLADLAAPGGQGAALNQLDQNRDMGRLDQIKGPGPCPSDEPYRDDQPEKRPEDEPEHGSGQHLKVAQIGNGPDTCPDRDDEDGREDHPDTDF